MIKISYQGIDYYVAILFFLLYIQFLNAFFDEAILRKHIIYRWFLKKKKANVIGFKEVILAMHTGGWFYSLIEVQDGERKFYTKISRSKNDYINREIDVLCLFNSKIVIIRSAAEELYCMNLLHGENVSDGRYLCERYLLITLLLFAGSFFMPGGIGLLLRGIFLSIPMIMLEYIFYPLCFLFRWLIWKTNLTKV